MATKKRFSQAQWDKLTLRRAKAILALRKARQDVQKYQGTHTSGVAREGKHKSR
jgi:hypothetical protein